MRPTEVMLSIGRPIAYYPKLAKHVGGVKACIFLCQLLYWSDKTDNPLGVYKDADQWEEETGLSYREQATARKALKELSLIIETHKRLEHRIYFRVDFEMMDEVIFAVDGTRISRNNESAVREMTEAHSVLTENTTESTTKSVTPKKRQRLDVSEFQNQVDTETLQAFVDHRKAIRAPLTQRALKLAVDSAVDAANELGITAAQALDVAIESGWRTIKVDWLRNRGFSGSKANGAPECPHAELLAIWDEKCGPIKGKAPNLMDWKGTKSAEALRERWEEFYAPDGTGRYTDHDSGLRWWRMALETIAGKQDFKSADVSIWDIFYKTRFSKAANGKLSGTIGATR